MFGILFYLVFLVIGYLYADWLFQEKGIYFRIWCGALIGNLALMAGIIPFAFLFGFTLLSHLLLLVVFLIPYLVLGVLKKAPYQQLFRRQGAGEELSHLMFACLILPVTLVICVLMTNHIMAPYGDGAIASGQSTYGDLAMHMGFITSIAEQQTFPPDYNLLAGVRLSYPFLIDSLSSSLCILGTGLRAAILLPGYVFALLLAMGFYFLAKQLTGRSSMACIATVIFFLCGGFGFAYFFEGAKADPTQFTRIFTEYYQTPTNFNDNNIRWSNTICDMIVPQRTTMAGWGVLFFALWLLVDALRTKKRSRYLLLGLVAGCMPMIHTHSFLALGIISAALLIVNLFGEKEKKNYLVNWCVYGGIALAMALPQLFLWTFGQTGGNESFLVPHFNWVNEKDPYLWFYIKNWGLVFLLAIPAFLNTSKENKKLFLGGALIFLIAEVIVFQPNYYDNNKLFYVTYMLAVILVSEYLVVLFEKLKGIRGRSVIAALVLLTMTLSGALTIGREYNSGAEYQTFSKQQIAFAEFVKENTDVHATFATSNTHLNPVAVLAGRNIFVGTSLYLYFHGLGEEMNRREAVLEELYSASTRDEAERIARENGIRYILLTASEEKQFQVNKTVLGGFETVYDQDSIKLYEVK